MENTGNGTLCAISAPVLQQLKVVGSTKAHSLTGQGLEKCFATLAYSEDLSQEVALKLTPEVWLLEWCRPT